MVHSRFRGSWFLGPLVELCVWLFSRRETWATQAPTYSDFPLNSTSTPNACGHFGKIPRCFLIMVAFCSISYKLYLKIPRNTPNISAIVQIMPEIVSFVSPPFCIKPNCPIWHQHFEPPKKTRWDVSLSLAEVGSNSKVSPKGVQKLRRSGVCPFWMSNSERNQSQKFTENMIGM